jgi:hypothetical protein
LTLTGRYLLAHALLRNAMGGDGKKQYKQFLLFHIG